MKCGLLALLLATSPCWGGAAIYRDIEVAGGDGPDDTFGVTTLSLLKADGRKVEAPKLGDQVGFQNVGFSSDGRRAGWLALSPPAGTSYPVPTALVIFRNDRVERVIREDQCIFRWTFKRRNTAVAYRIAMLHFSDWYAVLLRDIRSGRVLARYDIPDSNDAPNGAPDSNSAARRKAIAEAPEWARGLID